MGLKEAVIFVEEDTKKTYRHIWISGKLRERLKKYKGSRTWDDFLELLLELYLWTVNNTPELIEYIEDQRKGIVQKDI